jgi:hypothetical protein
MLTKHNYFVITMLFFVIFVLFMLVNVTNDYLTRDAVNPRTDSQAVADASESIGEAELTGDNGVMVTDHPRAVILTPDADGLYASLLSEWCIYQKYPYQIYETLPAAEEIADAAYILVGDYPVDQGNLPLFKAYAKNGQNLIFTSLPAYKTLAASPALADYFGIQTCVEPGRELSGIQFFDGFFVGERRVYTDGDDYGDEDEDTHISIDYYLLRAGYLVFAQGMLSDDTVDYQDLPPILWRTFTENSNIYVINTDLFENKALLGVLSAFAAQTEEFYIYPVVNAQTISVVDFPLLAEENTETLRQMYSRDCEELSSNVLWPGIDMILRNYHAEYSFFMASQLDYEDPGEPEDDLLTFYYKEIMKQSGALGLSLQQISAADLSTVCDKNSSFFETFMPTYRFTAVCASREEIPELGQLLSSEEFLSDVSLVMTETAEEERLLDYLTPDVLKVGFTTDGFEHESMDDLYMVALETALALNNQKVDLARVLYPEDEQESWNLLSTKWSRGNTYLNDFEGFTQSSIYTLEDRVRSFLAMDYQVEQRENMLTLTIDSPEEENSFILRMRQHEIDEISGAQYEKISDTAYLILAQSETVTIHFADLDFISEYPKGRQEVIK